MNDAQCYCLVEEILVECSQRLTTHGAKKKGDLHAYNVNDDSSFLVFSFVFDILPKSQRQHYYLQP